MRTAICLVAMSAMVFGCRNKGGSGDDDTGTNSTEPAFGGGCTLVEETPLEIDATTPTGVGVDDWLYSLIRIHDAELTWADTTTTGAQFNITNPTNARWLDYEVQSGALVPDMVDECEDKLAVDAQVSIVTTDGQLNEMTATTLTGGNALGEAEFTVDLSDPEGSLIVADWSTESHDSLTATLNATWNENGILGTIQGIGETSYGDMVTASLFDIATFGATGF